MLADSVGRTGWIRFSIEMATRPQIHLAQQTRSVLLSLKQTISLAQSDRKELAQLRKQLVEKEQALQDLRQLVLEQQVLGATARQGKKLTPARVVSNGFPLLVENHHFSAGSVVVSEDGALVGSVESVGEWTVRVKTIADATMSVPIFIVDVNGSTAEGVLVGSIGGGITAEKVLTEMKISEGAEVVTRGSDDKFPPGILVGWVGMQEQKDESAVYQSIRLSPAVDIQQMKMVAVYE